MTRVRLGDIVTVMGGGTPLRSANENFGGDIPWVTPKDMKGSEIDGSSITLTERGLANSPAKLVPALSVLVVVRSGVLKHTLPVAFSTIPVAMNQDMKALVPGGRVDGRYLGRIIKAAQPVVLSWVRATTADNFPIDSLLNMAIPLPGLVKQRRIVAILDHADALRATRLRILKALMDLESAIFSHAFGSCEDVAFQTFISEGPTNGLYQPASTYGSGTSIIRINSFDDGRLNVGPLRRLRVDDATLQRFQVVEGDVIINRVNSREHVGKAMLVPALSEPVVYESNMMRVRLNRDVVLPEYVAALLRTDSVRSQFKTHAKQAINQASINSSDVRSLRVPLASLDMQHRFRRDTDTINRMRSIHSDALVFANDLFASLQARAFRGEL